MAENYLSKLKIGSEVYNLKDAEAQAALALLGSAAQKNYESTLTDGGNLPTGAAVKSYVDAQIGTIHKFDVVIDQDGTASGPSVQASEATMYKLYLVPDEGAEAGDYIEWITIRNGAEGSYTYKWEKIGSTKTELSGYVPKERKVAGVDLQDDITVEEMQGALGLGNLAYADSASGSYTKATGIEGASYKPAGDVSVELSQTPTSMTATGTFTATGSVSKPSITVTPDVNSVVTAVTSNGQGPSFTEGAFTPASLSYNTSDEFAKAGVIVSVGTGADAETLIFTDASKGTASVISSFTGGNKVADTWNAGSMPTFTVGDDYIKNIGAQLDNAPVFTGTSNQQISVSGNYDKAGVYSASFEGTSATITPTLQTETDTVTVTA